MLLLGVDTGGTKTTCIVTDENLNFLGAGSSGPGNYYVVGEAGARSNIESAIEEALDRGCCDRNQRIVGGFGMGSLDTDEDYEIISRFLNQIDIVDELYIENDIVIAHYALMAGSPGITIVAGTGSIGYGYDGTNEFRTGGWGWLIGDEGSGYDAARQGLQAASKAADGRGPSTILTDLAKDHFSLDEFEDLFTVIYGDLDHPKNIASFAEPVARAAERGDEVAQRIVHDSAEELATIVFAISDTLDFDRPVKVGCVGSFGSSDVVSKPFQSIVEDRFEEVKFVESVEHPAVGGLAFAAERVDLSFDVSRLNSLDQEIETSISS